MSGKQWERRSVKCFKDIVLFWVCRAQKHAVLAKSISGPSQELSVTQLHLSIPIALSSLTPTIKAPSLSFSFICSLPLLISHHTYNQCSVTINNHYSSSFVLFRCSFPIKPTIDVPSLSTTVIWLQLFISVDRSSLHLQSTLHHYRKLSFCFIWAFLLLVPHYTWNQSSLTINNHHSD